MDQSKPVLLLLSGGPGGSELGRFLRFNQELERHFVVVVWEQRGCGKSYSAIEPRTALTVDQYVADIIELTNYLQARFHQSKIYLLGHSWGTIIGLKAAQQRPDFFYAYIGAAQMVNVRETDQLIYRAVLDYAEQAHHSELAEQLRVLGEPPYYGPNVLNKYRTVFGPEYGIFEAPYIKSQEYHQHGGLEKQLLRPEYTLRDKINSVRGMVDTFNVVYPQLQELDFRRDIPLLEVPVYFILGRHDMNGTYWLAEGYFHQLKAPHKRLYIFEDSGHGQIWQEPERFHAIMINEVLPETYQ